MASPYLPAPKQRWSHATNSLKRLLQALEDDKITAIEADFLMGHVIGQPSSRIEAVATHPPSTESDLSAKRFLDLVTDDTGSQTLKKHIKLDFKKMEVLKPILRLLNIFFSESIQESTRPKKVVLLNADIFQGPGCRDLDDCVDPDSFIEECLGVLCPLWEQEVVQPFALSLGFKVNYKSEDYYTDEDVSKLESLVLNKGLHELPLGLVFTVNARLLALNVSAFDSTLRRFNHAQLQAWTGTGEPPIAMSTIREIQSHFLKVGLASRLGFDCDIDESS